MLDLLDIGPSTFWLRLTIVFLSMARSSRRVRSQLESTFQSANATSAYQGPNINQLQPIFEHMLSVDIAGFAVSAVASVVELLLVLYHLLI